MAPVAGKAAPFIIPVNRPRLPYFKGLVYGEYGAGKTWLLGTAADVPEMQDVIMVSAEGGDLTLDPYDPDHNFGNIDPVRVNSYSQVARIYDYLKLHCHFRDLHTKEADEKLANLQKIVMPDQAPDERLRRYKTVIIDSLTEVEVYCMNQLLGVNDATKIDEESTAAEWAQYRQQHMMVQRLIRNFRDLPMHVLFTAARAYIQDENKRQIYSPMMTGKLAGQIQGFMDVVGYLIIGQAADDQTIPPRRLYIQQGPRFAAKSRFSAYKKHYFDNPTMGSILRDVGLLKPPAPKPGAAPVNAAKPAEPKVEVPAATPTQA
jgi:hypothetical protein